MTCKFKMCKEYSLGKNSSSHPFPLVPHSPSLKTAYVVSSLLVLLEIFYSGTSLVVQWLRLHTANAGAWVRSLVRQLRSNMPCSVGQRFFLKKRIILFV